MLGLCTNFFEHLNTLKIRYCHWKSNEHLVQALSGKTDLDVLVHVEDRSRFEKALIAFEFKKLISPAEKRFPGLEDYIGFDYETGGFAHIHLHYRLVLGQKYIKNHHLPIEGLVLENLKLKNNVFIPCPELELILLIIRAHMKVDLISLAKHAIKDMTAARYSAFPSDIENELSVLIPSSDISKLKILLKESKLPLKEEIFTNFIDVYSRGQLKYHDIIRTKLGILGGLKDYRRTKNLAIYLRYFLFFVAELPLARKFRTYKRKTMDGQGKIISIVGADGSGKTTLIRDLHEWLSWKLFVKKYYYGIPKNVISKLTYYLRRGLKKLRLNAIDSLVEAQYWLYVARARRQISIVSRREAMEGKIIITDRFPLKEFHHMGSPMDGPRLNGNSRLAGSKLAKCEAEIYDNIQNPDQIFVLQVGLDELRKRKADLSLETHKLKAQAVNSIQASGPIELIDANKPYNEVILEIKRLIWKIL